MRKRTNFERKKWTRQNEIKGSYRLLTPGLDNTCLFMSLTAGAGTRCMSLEPLNLEDKQLLVPSSIILGLYLINILPLKERNPNMFELKNS